MLFFFFFASHSYCYTPPHLVPGDLKAWVIKMCGALVKLWRSFSEIFFPHHYPLFCLFPKLKITICFLLYRKSAVAAGQFVLITAKSAGRIYLGQIVCRELLPSHTTQTLFFSFLHLDRSLYDSEI